MRQFLFLGAALALILSALWGCKARSEEETKTFSHTKYGFTLKFPAEWKVNEGNVIPPPPEGTTIGTDKFTLAVIPWKERPAEPDFLRKARWIENALDVGEVKVLTFTRPSNNRGDGSIKRAFLQHEGQWLEFALTIHGHRNEREVIKLFDAVIQSLSWAK